MDRRNFIQNVAGAPLVFGVWKFQDSETQDKKPKQGTKPVENTLALGIKAMKKSGLPGLVFVLPEDKDERLGLGQALLALSYGKAAPVYGKGRNRSRGRYQKARIQCRQALAFRYTCVFICLEASEAKKSLKSTSARILIDSSGQVLRQLKPAPKDPLEGMVPRLLNFVHGEKLDALRQTVKAQRSAIESKVEKSLSKLLDRLVKTPSKRYYRRGEEGELPRDIREFENVLKANPKVSSWMGLVAIDQASKKYSQLELVIETINRRSQSFPQGSYLPEFRHSYCLQYEEVKPGQKLDNLRNAIMCGMASLGHTGGRFLRFVADRKK